MNVNKVATYVETNEENSSQKDEWDLLVHQIITSYPVDDHYTG
jgi:hypothetical protein